MGNNVKDQSDSLSSNNSSQKSCETAPSHRSVGCSNQTECLLYSGSGDDGETCLMAPSSLDCTDQCQLVPNHSYDVCHERARLLQGAHSVNHLLKLEHVCLNPVPNPQFPVSSHEKTTLLRRSNSVNFDSPNALLDNIHKRTTLQQGADCVNLQSCNVVSASNHDRGALLEGTNSVHLEGSRESSTADHERDAILQEADLVNLDSSMTPRDDQDYLEETSNGLQASSTCASWVGSDTESANRNESGIFSNADICPDHETDKTSEGATLTLPIACLLCIEHYFEPQGACAPEECRFCHIQLHPNDDDAYTVRNNHDDRVNATPPTSEDNKFSADDLRQTSQGKGFNQQSNQSVDTHRKDLDPRSIFLSECMSPVMQPSSTLDLRGSDADLTEAKTIYRNTSHGDLAEPFSTNSHNLPMVHGSFRRNRHHSAEIPARSDLTIRSTSPDECNESRTIIAQAGSIDSLTTEPALVDLRSVEPYMRSVTLNSPFHDATRPFHPATTQQVPLLNDLFRFTAVNIRDTNIQHNDNQTEDNTAFNGDSL